LGVEVGWCEYVDEATQLVLVNRKVGLGRQVLLMGYSKKAQHQDVIGSFGEGLKVGAVALLRRGLGLTMFTKEESWAFKLMLDPAFGEQVLTVEVSGRPSVSSHFELEGLPSCLSGLGPDDTVTILSGLRPQEWSELSQRFLFLRRPRDAIKTEVGSLLLDPEHAGQLFVRGVYISRDPDLAAGVDLYDIRLDRDRAAVLRKSDLEHQVSSLWVCAVRKEASLLDRYFDMLSADRKCSDIALADLYCDDEISALVAAAFRQKYGDAVPISVKDANSARADQIRTMLDTTTAVCSQALLSVLRKGGVRCDLDDLLQEGEARGRCLVPLADLREIEMQKLALASELAKLADPSNGIDLALLDVFESKAVLSLENLAKAIEPASPKGHRIEIDRRALSVAIVHDMLGCCLCPCGDVVTNDIGGVEDDCCCVEVTLARSMRAARTLVGASEPAFGTERIFAKLVMQRQGDPNPGVKTLRCPDLSNVRETALRAQIDAVTSTLEVERCNHASTLRGLQSRVTEAEKELAKSEFRFMDAADAERALREEWGPELQRLRAETAALADAQEAAASCAKETAYLRRRCEDLEGQLAASREAAERRVSLAEERSRSLRKLLAQRWQLLHMLPSLDAEAAASETKVGDEFRLVMQEVRAALLEAANSCCVCINAPVDTVLLPCRHQQLCNTCAAELSTCPLCRAPIQDLLKVYL